MSRRKNINSYVVQKSSSSVKYQHWKLLKNIPSNIYQMIRILPFQLFFKIFVSEISLNKNSCLLYYLFHNNYQCLLQNSEYFICVSQVESHQIYFIFFKQSVSVYLKLCQIQVLKISIWHILITDQLCNFNLLKLILLNVLYNANPTQSQDMIVFF